MVHEYRTSFIGILRLVAGCLLLFLLGITGVAVAQQHPVPFINQPLVPDAAKPGSAAFTLTVNGSGFVAGSAVHWNGTARATTFVSSSKLTASIATSDIAKPGTASVTVVSPGPGGGTSNVAFFEVSWPGLSVGLARADYGTGTTSDAVVVGDFNRDGKLDIAVMNSGNSTVGVFLGNGDGTFQAQVEYPAPGFLNGMAVGDFNADGKLDLITVTDIGEAWIFTGNGDGTFQPAAFASYTGSDATSVAVGDFNLDGKLDLAVTDATSGVSIVLGNGNGTFQAFTSLVLTTVPTSVATGDFNGDGKLDLALANTGSGSVSVLLGNGDGTFKVPVLYDVDDPVSVTTGDLNGDDKLDLAVANKGSNTVSVLLGNGDGTFQPAVNYSVGTQPASVAVGDFNGDNKLDLAVANSGSNSVSVLLGNGDGTFQAHLDFATGSHPVSVAVGDFDGIGRPDLAVAAVNVASVLYQTTVTPASLTFATQLQGTTSLAQSVTLSNYGTAALSVTSMEFTGADPGDFAQTNTCGSSIAPGTSCTINVTFNPAQIGARTANLSVTDNAPGSPQTVRLTGVGTVVQVNPASLSFGAVPVGTSNTASTTLTNTGSTALSITGIVIAGADTDEFGQTNTCGTGLGAGKSCAITVTFAPKEKGNDSAQVSVSDNGGSSPQQVSLSGAGCVWEIVNSHRKCLTTASAAVQATLAKSRSATVPSVTGANRVGTRIIDLVDSSRIDPLATNGLNRELLGRFWYPASAEQGCKLADYTSSGVWNYFAALTGLPLPAVTTNSCMDAAIADGEHPVIVFTHGYTGTFTDYTFLFEDLASRGYVVFSIDHTYEATAVEFPDERLVKSRVGSHLTNSWQTDEQTVSSALSVRLDDLKFVVDELERLNTSTGTAFAGRLDLTRLALAGHSLGGLATWLGVQRDARFKAAVMLDPYLPDIPVGSTETPIMLLTMGREQRNENECQLWSDLRGPRVAVNLRGAEHVTPSDLVWLAKGAIKTSPTGPEKTIEALRDYIAAFLDKNVRGRPLDPLLTGPSSIFPDAEITTQTQLLCRQP